VCGKCEALTPLHIFRGLQMEAIYICGKRQTSVENKQQERLSVIVPTLNEAQRINSLMDALEMQSRRAEEIIIADAGSADDTRAIAAQRGAKVVEGGLPGVGRNAGAKAASGDIYLFLDADVVPGPDFIAAALAEFNHYSLGIATTLIEALENEDASNRVLAEATNLYLLMMQHIVPHAPGFCILTRREVHQAIGGFNETAKMAEDHDYVQRAARQSKFGVLSGVRIAVSMRRLEKEGLVNLAMKYLWAEMHALAGRPVYSMPFDYVFGTHDQSTPQSQRQWRILDIPGLRQQMAGLENPLPRLSRAGRYRVEHLLQWESSLRLRRRFRLALNRSELGRLQRYLANRLNYVVQSSRRELSERAAPTRKQQGGDASKGSPDQPGGPGEA
jgi:glycosyltransferase involved in cell wall biosynthesis